MIGIAHSNPIEYAAEEKFNRFPGVSLEHLTLMAFISANGHRDRHPSENIHNEPPQYAQAEAQRSAYIASPSLVSVTTGLHWSNQPEAQPSCRDEYN
jgi:hypothetical protein